MKAILGKPVFNYQNLDCEVDDIILVGNYTLEKSRTMMAKIPK